MAVTCHPRIDPYVRNYRIRLLPRVSTLAKPVSVPASLSMGSMANQMTSMRIIWQAHGQSVRITQDGKLVI